MPIVYSAIAKRGVIQCAFQTDTGQFERIVTLILQRMHAQKKSHRKSYLYEGYSYNYLTTKDMVYFCVADQDFTQRLCWGFLRKIRDDYDEDPSDFDEVLEKRMKYFSYNPRADKINAIRQQVHEVQDIMMENIETVLKRGEKIDDLALKTADVQSNSFQFQQGATVTKHKTIWKNIKLCGCIICMLVVLLIVVLLIASIAVKFMGVSG